MSKPKGILPSLVADFCSYDLKTAPTENDIQDADDTLAQIHIELPAYTGSDRGLLLRQIRAQEQALGEAKRRLLVGDGSRRTLTEEQVQERGLRTLVAAKQQLAETEQVGQETLQALARQREQLAKIKAGVKQTNDEMSWANRLVTGMSRWWRG